MGDWVRVSLGLGLPGPVLVGFGSRIGPVLASIGPCELGFDPIKYLINKKLKLKS